MNTKSHNTLIDDDVRKILRFVFYGQKTAESLSYRLIFVVSHAVGILEGELIMFKKNQVTHEYINGGPAILFTTEVGSSRVYQRMAKAAFAM